MIQSTSIVQENTVVLNDIGFSMIIGSKGNVTCWCYMIIVVSLYIVCGIFVLLSGISETILYIKYQCNSVADVWRLSWGGIPHPLVMLVGLSVSQSVSQPLFISFPIGVSRWNLDRLQFCNPLKVRVKGRGGFVKIALIDWYTISLDRPVYGQSRLTGIRSV